ncbi:MAG: polysaccharide deacetylase family protein [Pseudomonadota bacterium]
MLRAVAKTGQACFAPLGRQMLKRSKAFASRLQTVSSSFLACGVMVWSLVGHTHTAVADSIPPFAANPQLLLSTTPPVVLNGPAGDYPPSPSPTDAGAALSRLPQPHELGGGSGENSGPAAPIDPSRAALEPIDLSPDQRCLHNPGGLGVSRIIEIDAHSGPLFGAITKEKKEPNFLGPKEVVLTFDDGPVPWITQPILDTLAKHCTRATFFSVGRMAINYPDALKAVVRAGHTVGGHTWSHPLNLRRLPVERAIAQIERGFSGIAKAIEGDVAPFFRFPGLSDSPQLLAYLQSRGIASFTVDVVSDDSFISDADELIRVTLARIRRANGGIILFHDIKTATAKALPVILDTLSEEGYKVVHLRARRTLSADPNYPAAPQKGDPDETLSDLDPDDPTVVVDDQGNPVRRMVPFYRVTALERALDPAIIGRPVSVLQTPARERIEGLGTTVSRGPMPTPPVPERRSFINPES